MRQPLSVSFWRYAPLCLILWICIASCATAGESTTPAGIKPVAIASKLFTESVVLGEMLHLLAEQAGASSLHHQQLGGTRIIWNALISGEVDAYVEYTGTLTQEILQLTDTTNLAQLRAALAAHNIQMSAPLGFNNTYALGLPAALAQDLRLQRISDLQQHPQLSFGFSHEFIDRADGWPGLRTHYQLPQRQVTGLNHDLAYRALENGDIQLMDVYTTDAEIAYYQLHTLIDDRSYFPDYHALILYRADLSERAPAVIDSWQRLEQRIDAPGMSAMNAAVKLDGRNEALVAAEFLARELGETELLERAGDQRTFIPALSGIAQRTLEHLQLVGLSLALALLIALPLGIIAAQAPRWGRWILSISSVLQTIPSLALFVFLIPPLGIGARPAIAALFLYSLLPIVRNTYSGLRQIPASLRDSARALGLPPRFRLWHIELPLASRTIIAGIQTAAVINVGTATLAALIGAGGYGQPILTGIRLDDTGLIMQGAVPAALMALAVQALFNLTERYLVPAGLRLKHD